MANLTSQNIAVAKLYTALFNRAPDANGFAFWLQAVNSGASLASLAQTVLTSPEALAVYPASQTNAQFVTAFYTTVFGRAPDAEGLAFWSAALQADGGASSIAARAALVMQITDLVSSPLASKPASMSDAAYAQTVADRAVFANKLEFSVYFATELKSNDLTLAKSTLALVTDNPLSLAAATKLALGIVDPVAAPPAEPALNLTSADTPAEIISKLAAYTGTNVTANATGMLAPQLAELVTGIAKIGVGGITGTLLLSSSQTASQLSTLLGTRTALAANVTVDAALMDTTRLEAVGLGVAKVGTLNNLGTISLLLTAFTDPALAGLLSKGSALNVVTTGAGATALALLSDNIGDLAVNGITGTLSLTNALTADQFGNLLGTKTAAVANVVVDATNLVDSAKLLALVNGIAKVDALDNLSLDLNLVDDSSSLVLLDKGSAGMRASTTGASTAEIAKVVEKISLFVDGGLSGALTLTPTQLLLAAPSTLNAKLAGGFALSVVGGASNDIIDLSALTQGVKVSGGAGADTITLSSGIDTLVLGVAADTRSAAILGTDTNTAKIDKISLFAGVTTAIAGAGTVDKIQLSIASNAYGAGLTFSSATAIAGSIWGDGTIPAFGVSGNTPSNFTALFALLNGNPGTASTNTVAQMVYVYFATAGNLQGGFLVINDTNASYDANDTIISLNGVPASGGNLAPSAYLNQNAFIFG